MRGRRLSAARVLLIAVGGCGDESEIRVDRRGWSQAINAGDDEKAAVSSRTALVIQAAGITLAATTTRSFNSSLPCGGRSSSSTDGDEVTATFTLTDGRAHVRRPGQTAVRAPIADGKITPGTSCPRPHTAPSRVAVLRRAAQPPVRRPEPAPCGAPDAVG